MWPSNTVRCSGTIIIVWKHKDCRVFRRCSVENQHLLSVIQSGELVLRRRPRVLPSVNASSPAWTLSGIWQQVWSPGRPQHQDRPESFVKNMKSASARNEMMAVFLLAVNIYRSVLDRTENRCRSLFAVQIRRSLCCSPTKSQYHQPSAGGAVLLQ